VAFRAAGPDPNDARLQHRGAVDLQRDVDFARLIDQIADADAQLTLFGFDLAE
jgi:hypothetical protein